MMVARTHRTSDFGKEHQNLASQRHQCRDSRAPKYAKIFQEKGFAIIFISKLKIKLLNQPSPLF